MKHGSKRLWSILLTLVMLFALAPGMSGTAYAATTTVTWNDGDITGRYGSSFSKDGVTITCLDFIDFMDKNFFGGGTITTTLGNFTKIEVSARDVYYLSGTGWSTSSGKATWTGNATSVSFSGDIVGMGRGVTFVFTIETPSVAVTGVTLNKDSATLTVGGTETLTATVLPADATDKTVTWASDNTAVATVADGVVTAVAPGTANITVTATNGTAETTDDFTATCAVTVNKADPTAPTGLTATYGQTLADVALPTGWTWADSTQSVGNVVSPAATFKANFAENDNYNAASNVDVTVTVSAVDPTDPTDLTATYGDTLASVTLPEGWAWADSSASVGNAGPNTFKASYTPTSANYNSKSDVDVTVTVSKATGTAADGQKPTAKTDLIADNTDQALLTAPAALPDGYTAIQYSVDNGETWTDAIPTGKEPGSYTVKTKYIGDGNHNDFDGDALTVEIKGPDYQLTGVTGTTADAAHTWYRNSGVDVVITVKDMDGTDDSFAHFTGVLLDGAALTRDTDYTARQGSTVVTLKAAKVQGLSLGGHTVTIVFDNTRVETQLTVRASKASPDTGVRRQGELWAALAMASGIALCAAVIVEKKRRAVKKN